MVIVDRAPYTLIYPTQESWKNVLDGLLFRVFEMMKH